MSIRETTAYLFICDSCQMPSNGSNIPKGWRTWAPLDSSEQLRHLCENCVAAIDEALDYHTRTVLVVNRREV